MQAKKNQNYYLREQSEEGHGDWFRFVKTMEPYRETVLITPDMAKELLDSENQMSLRKSRLKSKEVTISFYGDLLTGKDLLEKVVEVQQPKELLVTFNVLDKVTV
jgi:hypothetical protein